MSVVNVVTLDKNTLLFFVVATIPFKFCFKFALLTKIFATFTYYKPFALGNF